MIRRFLKFTFVISLILLIPIFFGNQPRLVRNKMASLDNQRSNKLVIKRIIQSENTDLLDRSFEKFREQNLLKGLAVAIVKDERLIFAKGYGFADAEAKISASPEQLFRIASVSKLVTAIAVMKLVESGKISLNSKVFGKYGILNDEKELQIKDNRLNNITIRNLLNHSAGWTQRYGDIAFLPRIVSEQTGDPMPLTISSYIKFVISRRLHFEPGSSSAYSNLGYMILGEVIARVSKTSYEKYVKENILKPAHIYDMQLGGSFENEKLLEEVRYYQPEDAQPVEAFDGSGILVPKIYGSTNMAVLGSAGGWIASPIDLMKLLVVIDGDSRTNDILSMQSIAEMTHVDEKGLDPLGWRSTNENGEWWRTGTLPGSSALLKREPNGISWIMVTNTSNYKGPHLAIEMDRVMSVTLRKINNWPDYNLFDFFPK
ncbi:MAG: serine hydrolase domain-containing protein [Prolixibacteraceae bacterium]